MSEKEGKQDPKIYLKRQLRSASILNFTAVKSCPAFVRGLCAVRNSKVEERFVVVKDQGLTAVVK